MDEISAHKGSSPSLETSKADAVAVDSSYLQQQSAASFSKPGSSLTVPGRLREKASSSKETGPSSKKSQGIKLPTYRTMNDFQGIGLFGSPHEQVLQQQALHQATLHQQSLKQHCLQSPSYMPMQSHQHGQSHQQGHSKFAISAHPQSPPKSKVSASCKQVVKLEPVDADKLVSPLDRISSSGQKELKASNQKKGYEEDSSNKSLPLVSDSECKTFDCSATVGARSESLQSQGCSETQFREGVFADLNSDPPVSEGEEAVQKEGFQSSAQPECSRTPPEEKKRQRRQSKDPAPPQDGEDGNKQASKPEKLRSKIKGEVVSEHGIDADVDSQLVGFPVTGEERIKSFKMGLINVARKLPKNAHAHFALGLMYQRLGQPNKAASSFQKTMEILKKSEEENGHNRAQFLALVQTHYAQCLLQSSVARKGGSVKELQSNEIESLLSKLKDAILADGGHLSVWNTLGVVLLRSGRTQSAISVFTALLSISPDHLDALANLGVAYLHHGNLDLAARCFQSIISKDSSHPGALVNYGVLLLHQHGTFFPGSGAGASKGTYSAQHEAANAARKCLFAALKEDPKAGYVWVNLAAAYAVTADLANASKCLEQALKLEPSRMSIRYAVAIHRVREAERYQDPCQQQLSWAANEMASILREAEPLAIRSHIAWAGLALVIRAQHENAAAFDEGDEPDSKEAEERAIHTLYQAIEENPDDAMQWHQLGLHTLCTLQFKAAQRYLKMAITRRQTCATAWSNLGIALQLSEDPSLAESVYRKALSLAQPESAHGILSNLGNLYRQQRRFPQAHQAFTEALRLCPGYAPACNNLGLLLVAKGQWDEAVSAFDRALAADPLLDAAKSNKMKAEALISIHRKAEERDSRQSRESFYVTSLPPKEPFPLPSIS